MKNEAYYLEHPIGRLTIRYLLIKYALIVGLREGIPRRIAFKLPRKVVLWCLVRIAAGTLHGNEQPDRHNYANMYQRWEKGEGA